MSSTPLFDALARRAEQPAPQRVPVPSRPHAERATVAPVPTSPLAGPSTAHGAAVVPAALVAAIEEIPARVGNVLAAEHTATEQATTEQAASEHVVTDHAAAGHVVTDHAAAGHVVTDHAAAEHATAEHATTGHAVAAEELVLVEAVADAITRAVVDAVVHELDRITRDGVVRA